MTDLDRAKQTSNAIDLMANAGSGAVIGVMALIALRVNGVGGLGSREALLFGLAGIVAAAAYVLAGGSRATQPPYRRLISFVLAGSIGGLFLAVTRALPAVAPSTYTMLFGVSCGAALGALGGLIEVARKWNHPHSRPSRAHRTVSWLVFIGVLLAFAVVVIARPDAV